MTFEVWISFSPVHISFGPAHEKIKNKTLLEISKREFIILVFNSIQFGQNLG